MRIQLSGSQILTWFYGFRHKNPPGIRFLRDQILRAAFTFFLCALLEHMRVLWVTEIWSPKTELAPVVFLLVTSYSQFSMIVVVVVEKLPLLMHVLNTRDISSYFNVFLLEDLRVEWTNQYY